MCLVQEIGGNGDFFCHLLTYNVLLVTVWLKLCIVADPDEDIYLPRPFFVSFHFWDLIILNYLQDAQLQLLKCESPPVFNLRHWLTVCNSPSVYLSLRCLGRFERSFFTTEKIFTQYQEAAEDLCFSLQERRTASVRLLFTLHLKIYHFRWWCQSSVARSHEGRFSRSSTEVKLHLSKQHLQAETWKERKTQPCFLLVAFPQRSRERKRERSWGIVSGWGEKSCLMFGCHAMKYERLWVGQPVRKRLASE